MTVTHRLHDDNTGRSVGNGDGKVQKGEAIDVAAAFENRTGAELSGMLATLRLNAAAEGVEVVNSPVKLGDGKKTEARVTFKVKQAKLELRFETEDGQVFARVPIDVAIE